MRSRGLVVALALLLAIGATAAVFLYVNGVREDAKTGGDLIEVVVATQDIPANAELTTLLDAGAFTTARVTPETLVSDAVTDPEQLRGQTTTFPILSNEQIPLSRIGVGEQIEGGLLGISPGHVGTTVRVDGPPGVGGNLARGDNVVVYATFSGVKVFKSFKELVNQATNANPNAATAPTTNQEELPALTLTLIPTVTVLDVENPVETADGKNSEGQVTLTLDLLPEDSANLVYAVERGSLYFGLLPPGEEGVQLPAASVPIDKVLGEEDGVTEASIVAVGTPQSFRQQLARALEVEADEVGWVQSATAAEEMLINAFQQIDCLVLSSEVKEADALGLAEFVGRSAPGTAIVLVRDHTWNGLLPAAMRAGIRDVVDLTQGSEELRDAVERAIVWAKNLRQVTQGGQESTHTRGRIISVFSSKGGTGKTFLTTNLATAMAELTGKDTAVVDLDIDMGDVFTYFGREPSATIQDLMALGEGGDQAAIREAGVKLGDHIWAYGAPPDPAAEAPAGEAVGKFLRALRSNFPYLVVDASVDYSDSALVCFDLSDAICLVTGLDVVGVKHLSKALDTLLSIGLPRERFHVVLNRADSKVGLDASDVERVMKIQVDAMIPSSRLVPTSLNKGRPVVLDEPTSEVSVSIRNLASKFVGAVEPGERPMAPTVKRKFRLFSKS